MIITVDVDQELLAHARRMYGARSDAQAVEFALRDALIDRAETGSRRRPSRTLSIAAARLRVHSDRAVRRKTPRWIIDLANDASPAPPSRRLEKGNQKRISSRAFEARAQRFWPNDIQVGDIITDRWGGEYLVTRKHVRLRTNGPDYALGTSTESEHALIRYSSIIEVRHAPHPDG